MSAHVDDGRTSSFTDGHRLGHEEFAHYLARQAADLLDERVQRRDERRNKMVSLVLSVALGFFGLVGAGAWALLRQELNDEIERHLDVFEERNVEHAERLDARIHSLLDEAEALARERGGALENLVEARLETQGKVLESAVAAQEARVGSILPQLENQIGERTQGWLQAEVDPLQRQLDESLSYQNLLRLASDLAAAPGFNPEQRDQAKRLIVQLAGSGWLDRPGFAQAIEQVIDAFHEAGLSSDIDELDRDLATAMAQSPGISFTLLDHYGQRAVSAQAGSEEAAHVRARFRHYASAAGRHHLRERAVLWELLLAHQQDDSGAALRLIRELSYLEPSSVARFAGMLFQYCNAETWTKKRSLGGDSVADAAAGISLAWGERIRPLLSAVERDPDASEWLGGHLIMLMMRAQENRGPAVFENGYGCAEIFSEVAQQLARS